MTESLPTSGVLGGRFSSLSFARFSWAVLGVLLLVILWGSFVRASGSGAGCGSHWPLCNGVLLPETTSWKTFVEFTHRLSSGLSLCLCVGIWVWGRVCFPQGSLVRKAGLASLLLILAEALIGAGLVLLRLVEQDQSYLRAVSLVIHFINTFFLLAAVTLTARWAEHPAASLVKIRGQGLSRSLKWASGGGVLLLICLGASGAIAALGDTLFPATSLLEGFRQDLSPSRHFLIQLRIFHPMIAIGVSLYLIVFARLNLNPQDRRQYLHASLVLGLQCLQLILGFLNVVYLAPIWIQMAHLFIADLIWINFILLLSSIWVKPHSSEWSTSLRSA